MVLQQPGAEVTDIGSGVSISAVEIDGLRRSRGVPALFRCAWKLQGIAALTHTT